MSTKRYYSIQFTVYSRQLYTVGCLLYTVVMKILAVFTKKPNWFGKVHPHTMQNLDKAIEIQNGYDKLYVCGGKTRKGYDAEAIYASTYLKDKAKIPIDLEVKSRSTSENVRFLKNKLEGIEIEKLTVVVSAYHLPRVRYYFECLFPEVAGKLDLIVGYSHIPVVTRWLEFSYLRYARLDPEERGLAHWTKVLFRNEDVIE